jgi:hypothetical protein
MITNKIAPPTQAADAKRATSKPNRIREIASSILTRKPAS